MILIVNETVEIPYFAGKDCFNPYCEIDDVIGESYLKAFAYRKITQEELATIDLSKWKKVDVLRGKTFDEAIKMLSPEQKQIVFDYIRELISPKIEMKPIPKIPVQMTVPELRYYAKKQGIEIPDGVTKKLDILELIKQSKKVE